LPQLPLQLDRLDLKALAHKVGDLSPLWKETKFVRDGKQGVPRRDPLLNGLNALRYGRGYDWLDDIRRNSLRFQQNFAFRKIIRLLDCSYVQAEDRNQSEWN